MVRKYWIKPIEMSFIVARLLKVFNLQKCRGSPRGGYTGSTYYVECFTGQSFLTGIL
jgi:hypothetical protein